MNVLYACYIHDLIGDTLWYLLNQMTAETHGHVKEGVTKPLFGFVCSYAGFETHLCQSAAV